MATPLPMSPFIDPTKCDPETVMAHMLSEINYTVGVIAREHQAKHATQADFDVIVDTLREAAGPKFLADPSPEYLDAINDEMRPTMQAIARR